ncbi:hypothetical protein, partial [Enterococcus casseliflavus]|uniref:hypothetical protein n=1 Tax=Enterococcus casseliflavus TaxID=37734 RepID=UPI0019D47680
PLQKIRYFLLYEYKRQIKNLLPFILSSASDWNKKYETSYVNPGEEAHKTQQYEDELYYPCQVKAEEGKSDFDENLVE